MEGDIPVSKGRRQSSQSNKFPPSTETSSGSLEVDEKDEALDKDVLSAKEHAIEEACEWRNIENLQELAVSEGGFLSDRLRRKAWPVLLGLRPEIRAQDKEPSIHDSWSSLPRHRDEDQVKLDVNRAFIYYPNSKTTAELDLRKIELSDLIVEVLRRHPYLCYFQGYHDICQVFLLVLSPSQRAPAVARLSALRIRDFMLPSLAPAIAQLRLLPEILDAVDPLLYHHLSQTEPFFALSGTLTMYAHDIQTLGAIARVFDALLAREPVFSVYVFAAIVQVRRDELFDTPADEPEMLHSILSKLPPDLDLDALLARADRLARDHPPESLPGWRRAVSENSVLKTARDSAACAAQSMDQGRVFFDRQVRELEWVDRRDKLLAMLWAHRGTARLVAATVGVGVLALLLRRSPGVISYFGSLGVQLAGE